MMADRREGQRNMNPRCRSGLSLAGAEESPHPSSAPDYSVDSRNRKARCGWFALKSASVKSSTGRVKVA